VFLIGDVQSGPSSIVGAIGGARRAADLVLSREHIAGSQAEVSIQPSGQDEIYRRKGSIAVTMVDKGEREAFVAQEAHRCLECNYLCSKCVDVCPNRANVAIAVPGFKDQFQTLHLDAYCNECGNCAQFCPWQGKPYQDKVTIFSLPQDFDNSRNPGFYLAQTGEGCGELQVRQDGETYRLTIDAQSRIKDAPEALGDMCRIISHVHAHHHYLLGAVEA
ncbi:MAG: putative selenate reductase subunit YgfK, partial [Aeromonas sobria]